jgi:hypothetical protein
VSTHGSLYRSVMGAAFESLPAEVQRFHSLQGTCVLSGRVAIDGPKSRVGALVARIMKLPAAAADAPMQFKLCANHAHEVWTRCFPGRDMTSTMSRARGRLVESLGPLKLHFRLVAGGDRLTMQLERVTALGVRCPRWLMPIVEAEETESPGRLHFDVEASLPRIGRVVRYRGYLDLNSASTS